jgi:hypothetical protein
MVDGIIFVSKGNMYVIGMDTEKPVYFPITMHELKLMLEHSKNETWHNASHPSNTETLDIHFPAENVMSADKEE